MTDSETRLMEFAPISPLLALPRAENSEVSNGGSFTSYSLNFEDVILNRLFPNQLTGFYCDVGAGHPCFENDLYAFYKRGWSGINVEPNENFFALLQQMRCRDRNLAMVLSDVPEQQIIYYEVEGSGLSTCDADQARRIAGHGHAARARPVQVGTLAGILADAMVSHIDILKVDVEGFEEKVLSGNDWERFRPSVVLVEATFPESPRRRPTNIRGFMEQRGYQHVHFDGLNDFYLERSTPVPDGLTLPPNVFDRFVSREIADLRAQAELLQNSFKSAENYAFSLQDQIQSQADAASTAAVEPQDQYDASREIADLRAQVASLQHSLQSAETYAFSLQDQIQSRADAASAAAVELQSRYDELLARTTALAAENRRKELEVKQLTLEGRRLRSSSVQMHAELLALNRLLEPLHAVTEQMEWQRRMHADQLERTRAEITDCNLALHNANVQLEQIYSSRSWLLTKPWRFAGRLAKRLIR